MLKTTTLFPSFLLSLLAYVLLFNLSACSSINRQVKYDHGQSFESMLSYNFKPVPDNIKAETNYQLLQQGNIRLAIENAMAGKKIRKETSLTPDFWLNYYLTAEQPVSAHELNALFDYSLGLAWDDKDATGHGKSNNAHTFSRRTLIIDLVSPEQNRLIWRGSTTTGIKPDDTPAEIQQAVQKAARGILKPFPPRNLFSKLKKGIPD